MRGARPRAGRGGFPGAKARRGGSARGWRPRHARGSVKGTRLGPARRSPGGAARIAFAVGFALSLAAAFCFGLYVLPRRYSALDPWAYAAGMGGSAMALSAVLWLALAALGHAALPPRATGRSVASAAVWLGGNFAYVLAIDRIGVARASAIKNLAALFGTLAGLLLVGERLGPAQGAAAVAGSALVVAAAALVGASRPAAGAPAPTRAAGRVDPAGVLCALGAAAGIGCYLIPARSLIAAWPWGFLQYQVVLGAVGGLGSLLPHAVRRVRGATAIPRAAARLPWLAGATWYAGSLLVTPATALVGIAISWPLSQLSFYVTLAWGVLRLHEIDVRRSRGAVATGAVCTLLALGLLGWARLGPPAR